MNDLFLRACRREPTERTPLWLMRQAGRYLPEYRALREKYGFLDLIREPELAAEVTLQPLRRFPLDAAILFADILTPLVGAGIGVRFTPGPVLERPVRRSRDLDPLRSFDPGEAVPETLEAVRLLKRELSVPLLGFVGAPFTLACYLVDGKGTKDFPLTRALLYREPELGREIMEVLGEVVAKYAAAQVAAGADAVQVFDSWAHLLPAALLERSEGPALRRIFSAVRDAGAPSVYYANGVFQLLDLLGDLGCDVVGADWRVPLDAYDVLRDRMAVQGNLDPAVLFGTEEVIRREVREVLRRAGARPGHVFNLGHGLHRKTPLRSVEALVTAVREESTR